MLLLTALIAILSAPPAISAEAMTTLFNPTAECPAPCMMGIALETTSAEDAVSILEAHPWVAAVTVQRYNDQINAISWEWNGEQPAFIDTRSPGVVMLNFTGKRITSITISTDMQLSDLWRMIGPPPKVTLYRDAGGTMTYLGGYAHTRLHTYGVGDCPATANTFWRLKIQQLVWLSPYKDADRYYNSAEPYHRRACMQHVYSYGTVGRN